MAGDYSSTTGMLRRKKKPGMLAGFNPRGCPMQIKSFGDL